MKLQNKFAGYSYAEADLLEEVLLENFKTLKRR